MKVSVFNIERFAIHDGPGIRTSVFLHGCHLHCPWCSNPESQGKPGCWEYNSCEPKLTPKEWKTEDVVKLVLRDRDYYSNSGGGVTFTGGEALLQYEAVAEMMRACKENGLHTAIETTADIPMRAMDAVLPYTDLFLIDVKSMNRKALQEKTGATLGTVLGNIDHICGIAADKVRLRVPCIPGFNMSETDFKQLFWFASGAGVAGVDLLPFHNLGAGKYHRLGLKYEYEYAKAPSREELESLASIGSQMGLDVRII